METEMGANLLTIPDFPQCLADNMGNIYRIYNNNLIDMDIVSFTVHRLICSAFHGPCPKNMMSRYLDGNKTNNSPDNLCWGTAQDNSDDKWLHGTICVKEKKAELDSHSLV